MQVSSMETLLKMSNVDNEDLQNCKSAVWRPSLKCQTWIMRTYRISSQQYGDLLKMSNVDNEDLQNFKSAIWRPT